MPKSTDLILHHGVVLTMNERQPQASALALRHGRVLAVGNDDEVMALRRDTTQLLDLGGKTVCPGFIDAHHHLTLAGWCQLGIDLDGCRSATEACERIGRGLASVRSGAWVYAYNYGPKRFTSGHGRAQGLTRYDLDRVAGDRPALVMHFSYHEGVASSVGLALSDIDRRSRDPLGGRIVRDRAGEPTGELLETAVGPVERLARTAAGGAGYEDWLAAIQRYCQGLFAAGITHVCDPGVDGLIEGYLRRAEREGGLPLPVTMLFVSDKGLFQPPEDRLGGPRTGEQVDGLSVGALKVFADGGSRCAACARLFESLAGVGLLAARAAKMRRPGLLLHAGAPDTPHLGRDGRIRSGFLHYTQEALADLCARGSAAGFQLAVHAACNDAIDGVLAAYEPLSAGRYPHRIEHLVSLDATQARRIAQIGAIGVVQPAYVLRLGDEIDAMPAPPRLRSIPLRTLLDAGVPLAGSSDAPVAPYAPLVGMRAAITRRTAAGYVHQAAEAISAEEALRLWTTGAAYAANASGEIGVLKVGARADAVVLSANPLTTPIEQFDSIRVERTLLAGRTVYVADGAG